MTNKIEDGSQLNVYFSGYASVFNTIDKDKEVVLKGAFESSIESSQNISVFWEHDPSKVVGHLKSIKEDDRGLYVVGMIDISINIGKNLYSLIKNGSVKGLSIGYIPLKHELIDGIDYIKQAKLVEISIVALPSNSMAEIELVKNEDQIDSHLVSSIGRTRIDQKEPNNERSVNNLSSRSNNASDGVFLKPVLGLESVDNSLNSNFSTNKVDLSEQIRLISSRNADLLKLLQRILSLNSGL